jgi:hypothetical protein
MEYEQFRQQNPDSSSDEPSAQSALESAASYVAASTAANSEDHGSSAAFTASFTAILSWAEAARMIREEGDFPFLGYKSTGHGDEHEGWFDEDTNRWYKATYPNRFGIAWGRIGSATAGEYLNRLVLQNKHFGDDIRLIALVNCRQKLRILTSQPHIVGKHAEYEEICIWLRELGFSKFESNGSVAWYHQEYNLLVSDVHEGNVIRSVTGALFAIDLNLMNPQQEMRDLIFPLLERA